jgi:hypothetical protein
LLRIQTPVTQEGFMKRRIVEECEVVTSVPLAFVSLRFMQPKGASPCSATRVATAADGVGYCALDATTGSESYTVR